MWLRGEQGRLSRLIASVKKTITAEAAGKEILAEDMLDGFDHTVHKVEVEQRWSKEEYARSDAWWSGKSASEQAEWKSRLASVPRTPASAADGDVRGYVMVLAETVHQWRRRGACSAGLFNGLGGLRRTAQ